MCVLVYLRVHALNACDADENKAQLSGWAWTVGGGALCSCLSLTHSVGPKGTRSFVAFCNPRFTRDTEADWQVNLLAKLLVLLWNTYLLRAFCKVLRILCERGPRPRGGRCA